MTTLSELLVAEKRKNHGRRVIELSPIFCLLCLALIIAGNRYGFAASASASIVLAVIGLPLSRLLLAHYKVNLQKSFGYLVFPIGLSAPIWGSPFTQGHFSIVTAVSVVLYRCACMWGSAFLVFALFRNIFLRFIEAAD